MRRILSLEGNIKIRKLAQSELGPQMQENSNETHRRHEKWTEGEGGIATYYNKRSVNLNRKLRKNLNINFIENWEQF